MFPVDAQFPCSRSPDLAGVDSIQAAQAVIPSNRRMLAPGQCMDLKNAPVKITVNDAKHITGRRIWMTHGPRSRASKKANVTTVSSALTSSMILAPGQ